MKKVIMAVVLLCGMVWAQAQEVAEAPQDGLKNNEFVVQLNTQVGAHNFHGWKSPITGLGIYVGYSHFWDAHRLSGGVEVTYRNGIQGLLVPDYHYEWIVGRFRTAVGLKVLGGYCAGMGWVGGCQPTWEAGCFVTNDFSIILGIGYRVLAYSKVPEPAKSEVGSTIFEIPIELSFRF